MKPPADEVKRGAPEWVVTFGDMMSLLLTFFVLLLSFSSMEAAKFKVVAGYMRQAFGLQNERSYTGVPMGTTILSTEARESVNPSDQLDLIQSIRQELEAQGVTERVEVEATERGVTVRLEGELLFDSGQAKMREEAYPILDSLAELVKNRADRIEVEGHTDDVPIKNPRYPSNWELAAARAGSATRYLIGRGVPDLRLRAVAYAATRPLAANTDEASRKRNRRVEVLFVREVELNADLTPVPSGQSHLTDSPPAVPHVGPGVTPGLQGS